MTLEMKGIYKSFGANDVLRDVSFTLNGGEICALLGENGAGKSTLMNILGGVHHADQGQILLDGKRVAFQTPADSLKHGIAFIHQELNLVNDLAIYENMFIGHELRKKNRFLDSAAMIAKTNEVFKKMDLDLDHHGRADHFAYGAGNSPCVRYDEYAEKERRRHCVHFS